MPSSPPASLTPAVVYRMLRDHAWLWIAPAVAGLVLTAGVTLVTPRKWKATQGMIIRSEAAGYANQRLGKFTDLSEMKTVQETVLEVARSKRVLTAALKQVGPEPSWFGQSDFPSDDDIEALRGNLRVTPPGGAEFGATEVFYLTVLDTDSDRAVAIVDALAQQLDARMQGIRNEQALSMVSELEHAAEAARENLHHHTQKLAAVEAKVGADLGDLRNLVSPLGAQGMLAQKALAIETELRESEVNRRSGTELLAALKLAKEDTSRLLATPSALLASQPALERLKAGVINAQMRAASLQGTRSENHPLVIVAKEAERRHREQLHREIPIAIAGVEMELSLSKQREAALKAELAKVHQRVGTLAGRRAEYSSLVAAVENQTRVVDAAEAQLADARAYSAGANHASVLARVDNVEAGTRPVGPGRAAVSLAGGLGGLLLGLGLVFAFFTPNATGTIAQPGAHPGDWTELFPAPQAASANRAEFQSGDSHAGQSGQPVWVG